MNKIIISILLLSSLNSNAQSINIKNKFNKRYYDHWVAINSKQSLLEIIIYKYKTHTRVIEIDRNSDCSLGSGIVFETIYITKSQKGNMTLETINPSTFEILDSDYILTKEDKLLRITNKDTIAFNRKYE